jgi:hypothetical protein
MPISVSWDNDDKTTIRYDFNGQWTWDEFRVSSENAFAMTRSVSHTVDSISNFDPTTTLPPNALFQFRRAMTTAPKNRGVTVIVGGALFVRTMVGVFGKLNRQLGERLLLADTLDQARARLAERRSRTS